MRYHLLLALSLALTQTISSQTLPDVSPLPPEAAAMARYGETPISNFTGTANIAIPLYTINSGGMEIPLQLSYHTGGNKVEDIPSWVGLGWSLQGLPSISRKIVGIADERVGGCFGPIYADKSLAEIWASQFSGGTNELPTYAAEVYNNNVDTGVDIFQYSLPSGQGNFWYDEEIGDFVTSPKANIKITKQIVGTSTTYLLFTITDQDGTQYHFNDYVIMHTELESFPPMSGGGPDNVNSWKVSEMVSANRLDTISFQYAFEQYDDRARVPISDFYFHEPGTYLTSNIDEYFMYRSVTANLLTNYGKRLESISFRGGEVEFQPGSRQDLSGASSLIGLTARDASGNVVKDFDFSYGYLTGSGSSQNKWLVLNYLHAAPKDGAQGQLQTYSFTYNQDNIPPSRLATGQDFWGYYNGKDGNDKKLIPSMYIPFEGAYYHGSNRYVDPDYTQFGILERIDYPTGGATEYDYENNQLNPSELISPSVEWMEVEQVKLPGDPFPSGPAYFTIDTPPDLLLNDQNPNGGTWVDFDRFEDCQSIYDPHDPNYPGPISGCVSFILYRNGSFYMEITEPGYVFLENGNYSMNFFYAHGTDPSSISSDSEFRFGASWNNHVPLPGGNGYTGGLRIRETRDYSGPDPNSHGFLLAKTTRYHYTTEFGGTESSGVAFNENHLGYEVKLLNYDVYNGDAPYDDCSSGFSHLYYSAYKLKSYTNAQELVPSGTDMGYATVFREVIDSLGNNQGYTEYQYSSNKDVWQADGRNVDSKNTFINGELMVDQSHRRGNLLRQTSYAREGTAYKKVSEDRYGYIFSADTYGNPNPYPCNIRFWDFMIPDVSSCPGYPNTHISMDPEPYKNTTGWNRLSYQEKEEFNGQESIVSRTDYLYDNPAHLLPTSTITETSDGGTIVSLTDYPGDISQPSAPITELISQNRVALPIQQSNYRDADGDLQIDPGEMIGSTSFGYRVWHPVGGGLPEDIVELEKVSSSKGTQSLSERVAYHRYSTEGRFEEVSLAEGPHTIYLWGYGSRYPIAKIENATYVGMAPAKQTLLDAAVLASDNDTDTTKEDQLRTALEAIRAGFPESMVTTYTYDPLVGVTSMADPEGRISFYEYDNFNRLITIRDSQGRILAKNEYHTK